MSGMVRPFKWFYHEFGIHSIHETGRNAYLMIFARTCRMFAYGTNSLILAIFFSALEFSDHQIGLFMTLTLLGDVFLGTLLTLVADQLGRRRVLLGGSFLMVLSGIVFAVFENFWLLLFAAVVGVISITGGDFGPFRSIEESILSQLTTPSTRSDVLAWYVTASTLGSSIGSEASGRILHYLQDTKGWTPVDAYHALFWVYAVMGLVNALNVLLLTSDCEMDQDKEAYAQLPQSENETAAAAPEPAVEATTATGHVTTDGNSHNHHHHHHHHHHGRAKNWASRSASWLTSRLAQISAPTRSVMYKLWFLLALDSVADGMVPYSLTNYYMDIKFKPAKSTLGDVQSAAYTLNPDAVLGAISAVFAGPLARKIGLVNTMVFTHAPSSAAVLLFPLPPASAFGLVVLLLLVRAGLNMMDQAPRTALIAAVVRPRERTAVMGVTSTLRTLASMAGPGITGLLAAGGRFWVAFVVAGACRLAYDFGLWAVFVNVRLHQHEREGGGGGGGGKPGSDDGDDDGDGDGGHRRGGRNGRRRQGDEEEVLELARLSPSSPSPRLSAAFSVASSSLADGGSSDDSDDEDDDDDSDDVVKLGSQTTAFPASRSAAAAAAGSGSGSLQVPRAMGQGDTVRSRSPHRARAPDA